MTKKQFRNFSAEEKTKIVLELLKEDVYNGLKNQDKIYEQCTW